MPEPKPKVRVFAPWAEAPLAYICAALAVTTLIWKTVGFDLVPGWEDMFGGVGAQYPRRVVPMSPAWGVAYLLVYGVLGSAATVASVMVTRLRTGLLEPAGETVSRWARVHGLFHVILGVHHTAWALTAGAWGHLTLGQFELPVLYLFGGIGGLGAGLHGLRLLLSAKDTPTSAIVRAKIAVDGVSLLTFISVLVLWPMNVLGMERSAELERVLWALVFVGPVLWLGADQLVSRSLRRDASR